MIIIFQLLIPSKSILAWFLLADGFLSNSGHAKESFGITLKTDDRYILEIFRNDINTTYPIHDYTNDIFFDGIYYGKVKSSKILIKSTKIYNDLLKMGFTKYPNGCTMGLQFTFKENTTDIKNCVENTKNNFAVVSVVIREIISWLT